MKHSTVINAAPWFVILGLIPMFLSFSTQGSMSAHLETLSISIFSAVLGALTTHYPSREEKPTANRLY